jgi:hypothetical protein
MDNDNNTADFDDKALQDFCATEFPDRHDYYGDDISVRVHGADRPTNAYETWWQKSRDMEDVMALMNIIQYATYGQFMDCHETIFTYRNLIKSLNAEIEEAQEMIVASKEERDEWLLAKWDPHMPDDHKNPKD